ncbi:HD-GYP domain-containing protein [Paludibacterium yongneupense]|uniref:HD-GYP domain-containing protein n=1 Tax=Paludibacterium yongneupense TaxID=400061 RepID=UPI0004235535|nr:HD domain-containing phosphohydrolase [Paludibacterium yongneupense]
MAILIVDDNPTNLVLMSALTLAVDSRAAMTFEQPLEALEWCRTAAPDLVLLDFMMPDIDGHEFIRRFRLLPGCDDVPIVMVTTADEKAVRQEALELGVSEFLAKPVDAVEFRLRVRNLLALRHAQTQLKHRSEWLALEVERATRTIREREQELVFRLSRAAEFRDPETGSHLRRMAAYAVLIAESLGCDEGFIDSLRLAAPMHDIGKLGVPDYILLKPGRLSDEELIIMRSHAVVGARILSGSISPLIRMAASIAQSHHEKFDGSGYPDGLQGDAIPLVARIVAVADVFDALTTTRPYKLPWSVDEAREYILSERGRHFCPSCCDAFERGWEQVLEIRRCFPEDPAQDLPVFELL